MRTHQRGRDVGVLAHPNYLEHPSFLQRPPLPLLTRSGRASLVFLNRNGLSTALSRLRATAFFTRHRTTPVASATLFGCSGVIAPLSSKHPTTKRERKKRVLQCQRTGLFKTAVRHLPHLVSHPAHSLRCSSTLLFHQTVVPTESVSSPVL